MRPAMTSDGLQQQRRQESLKTCETQACSVQALRQRLGGRVGHVSDSSRSTVGRLVDKHHFGTSVHKYNNEEIRELRKTGKNWDSNEEC